jgi:hypothetical protein
VKALAAILALQIRAGAACLSIADAAKNIGRTTCVAGRVLKVANSPSGNSFLDFCEDYTRCPFTVVIFGGDMRDVGDIRKLEGKDIEIYGKIQLYGGRAEIILRNGRQLRGEAAKLPPLPKEYDAQRHGNYRATAPKPGKKTTAPPEPPN